MSYISTTLVGALIAVQLPIAAMAQEQQEGEAFDLEMTCAQFNELDEEGRTQAMEALATEIGMSEQEADDQTQAMHLATMTTDCEVAPEMTAMEAFQNAMDNPG
ncbi:HdeA/HdeB family chaperone [Roseitranquillus sediminis]|uniref:HdeA/HdeB family chaperone n=1 Tax=Roseitranquillus sediminis TaxID=2809051 RepID=UPI001D0C8E86|nr:HdeA/HdeB family chaperone [Roseitranquillus sediminis]MBM9595472.1 hypothetical protein [Roseitranquillus sediminis]